MYHCSECDAPAELEDGQIVRSCDHDDAAVIVDLRADMEGRGGIR